jgi:glycosyltransferase involved in cell wall biosynthesis
LLDLRAGCEKVKQVCKMDQAKTYRIDCYLGFSCLRIQPASVIPIAIDKKMFPPLPEQRDIDIIGVGSFSFQKNFDQFILIIAELKKEFPNIKAVHCGSGEDEKTIKALVEKMELTGHISLLGTVAHTKVLELMQCSKILLHPSSYEGFGMVHLEALYAGANVISFTKAMDDPIKNWFVVQTKKEMINKASELLRQKDVTHERVLVYEIEDTAKKVVQLFAEK